jgi:hypothetical protein
VIIDQCCKSCFLPDDTYNYKGHPIYTKLPFGPQMIDDRGDDKIPGEEFCAPWCLLLTQVIIAEYLASKKIFNATEAVTAMLKQLELSIPQSEAEAIDLRSAYYEAIIQRLIRNSDRQELISSHDKVEGHRFLPHDSSTCTTQDSNP